jgi:hypothetical protein
MDKTSVAAPKAKHRGAAADADRDILLTALDDARAADMLLIEPVTGILKGLLDLEATDGRTCGGMAIPKESTQ